MDISILNTVVSAGAGIVGGLLAVYLSKFHEIRREKIQTVLELYSQYQSNEMMQARLITDTILTEKQIKTVEEFKNLIAEERDKHWLSIAMTILFLEKFAVLSLAGYLNDKIASKTLLRYFTYWYEKHLKYLIEDILSKNDEWKEWAEPIKQLAQRLKKTHRYH